MYKRELTQKIKQGLAHSPAVAILGPRHVGKTTLALEVAKDIPYAYLDLETAKDFRKLKDLLYYMELHVDKLVILDQIQCHPDLFISLRRIIDQRRREGKDKGRFLLLGPASNYLLKQSSENLTGRITYLELSGLNPIEVEAKDAEILRQLWFRGGVPDSFSAPDDQASNNWRKDFIRTYLEQDIPQLGPHIPAVMLMRFWTMLAHNQGETFNASELASSLDISSGSASRYLDLMSDLLLVRKLEPWQANTKKKVIKSPRTYIRDSGIVHALLQIADYEQLLLNPILGKSWEGFVIESIISCLPAHIHPFFYRTAAGAEIDLLLETEQGKYWAIEITVGHEPTLKEGFHTACADFDIERKFVVYSGNEILPMTHEVMAMPLLDFLKTLKENLC